MSTPSLASHFNTMWDKNIFQYLLEFQTPRIVRGLSIFPMATDISFKYI